MNMNDTIDTKVALITDKIDAQVAGDIAVEPSLGGVALADVREIMEIAKLMDERPSRGELGPLLLCLSGGVRSGRPRHVPARRQDVRDARLIMQTISLKGGIVTRPC